MNKTEHLEIKQYSDKTYKYNYNTMNNAKNTNHKTIGKQYLYTSIITGTLSMT